jgi:hypothetical protein
MYGTALCKCWLATAELLRKPIAVYAALEAG